MSDLARLPSYPSPTTLIARSGIQFLDFGFDPTKLRVREWGFHDASASNAVSSSRGTPGATLNAAGKLAGKRTNTACGAGR